MKRAIAALKLAGALLLLFPLRVQAIELVITGNGDDSTNEVQTQVSQQTTVEQKNEASVSNEVSTTASTGDNTANANTAGQTQIQTGDITTQTQISNSLNTSLVEIGCCPNQTDLTASIEGNGSNSKNSIGITATNDVTVVISQSANVRNEVNGKANTGKNTANGNTNDVSIKTGDISGKVEIKNSLNHESVAVPGGSFSQIKIKIKDNGADSTNDISLDFSNNTIVSINNQANLFNAVLFDLNTGGNTANGNTGDVSIQTGDIVFGVTIRNDPINVGGVHVNCCEDPADPGDPLEPPAPPPPPPRTGGSGSNGGGNGNSGSSGNGNSSSSSGSGNVLAQAAGAILPATGSLWFLLATLANIAMFLMGLYLRLRSGRSPNLAFATVRA